MKLTLEGLKDKSAWERAGIGLPQFDLNKVKENTRNAPTWLHFGGGNIFRAFHAVAAQKLLDEGLINTGIVVCETFDGELIERMYDAHDNLAVVSTLSEDGSADHRVIASVTEALRLDGTVQADTERAHACFAAPSLQLVTFTITEKGYAVQSGDGKALPSVQHDIDYGPGKAATAAGIVCAGLLKRFEAGKYPLALVSTDNCSMNGDKLRDAVLYIARHWEKAGKAPEGFVAYLEDKKRVSFPLTMIDKITPRPDPAVEGMLNRLAMEDMAPIKTEKGTYIAPFANAEETEYLVVEDDFPAGRPPLEKAGVYMTDRETVNRVERMKVSTCLNPLHTALAVLGCLLGYDRIYEEMRDEDLVRLVKRIAYVEGMPVVTNPGIIDPSAFADQVITKRFPNPFIPDAPQRIATDTSQKLAVRFGETIKAYGEHGDLSTDSLVAIPFVLAAWLRYLMGKDDQLEDMQLSPDPKLSQVQPLVQGFAFGDTITAEQLRPILSLTDIFGVDLYKAGLADRVADFFTQMMAGKGAVRAALIKVAGV